MGHYENLAVDDVFASDAEWRTWCQAIDAGIKASGFMEVAPDTGQIDLTTAVRPAPSAYAGYKVYRGADAIQATKPIYLKVEFGVGGAITRPQLRQTFGTGSNGAGTMTGVFTSATGIFTPASDGTGVAYILAGGTASSFWLVQKDPTGSANDFTWFVARSCNIADLTPDADSIMVYAYSSGTSATFGANMSWTDHAAAWISLSNSWASMYINPGATHNNGASALVAKIFQGFLYRNGKVHTLPALFAKPTEVPYTNPTDSVFPLAIWAGVHNFLPIAAMPVHNTADARICLPYE